MKTTGQPIDINPTHLETIHRILDEHVPDYEVRAFGSRAKWNAADYSDLDLAVVGDQPLEWSILNRLETAFEESDLPFRVDVLDWHDISDKFRELIRNECISIKDAVQSDWKSLKLRQCVTINDSTYSTKEAWPFINYLDTGNITANHIESIQHLVAGEDKIPSRARRKVQLGDIVYSMVRPVQKHFGLIRNLPHNFLVSTGFSTIRAKSDIAHTEFIYYFLTQDHIIEHLQAIAENSTSAYPAIRPYDLEQLDIDLPPLQRQRDIAHILSILDDKIELNRCMNETLEAMAQALFKSWFIDFDPVQAKMEGRWRPGESLPGLPAHLYDLFPDRLVPSELGAIPERWEVGCFGDMAKQVHDKELPLDSPDTLFQHFSIPSFDSTRSPNIELGRDIKSQKSRVYPGVILISKLNPEIERIWLVDVQESTKAICSTEFLVLLPRPPFGRHMIYNMSRSIPFRRKLIGLVTGTSKSHQRAPSKAVLEIKFPLPPQLIIDKFEAVCSPLFEKTLTNRTDLANHAVLRDFLLILCQRHGPSL